MGGPERGPREGEVGAVPGGDLKMWTLTETHREATDELQQGRHPDNVIYRALAAVPRQRWQVQEQGQ